MFLTWGIILAAGKGSRMGASLDGLPKQFASWRDRPLYWHSALAMSASACVDGLVFVFAPEYVAREKERITELARADNLGLPWKVVEGGARRQDSSANGLQAVPRLCEKVLIHDAARPFVTPGLIRAVAEAVCAEQPAVAPAIGVTDTIKRLEAPGAKFTVGTLPRDELAACQTPQGFWADALRSAMLLNLDVTDDAMLMERAGHAAIVVPGETANIKITTKEDLLLLREEEKELFWPCVGFGYDVHRFGAGRPLKLGGIAIPGGMEVIAHSDGDVLIHAVMDSILGMAALGDIGRHFPDSDPAYNGISSAVLLDEVLDLARQRKVEITHVDMTVVAQKPKLAPYSEEIRANVARLLNLDPSCVNFKATTEEKLGFTGSGDGIKAYTVSSGIKPRLA